MDTLLAAHESCIAACETAGRTLTPGDAAEEQHVRLLRECADECRKCADAMRDGSCVECATCAAIAERCAAECEKHDSEEMRQAAHACRTVSSVCRSIEVMTGAGVATDMHPS